MSKNNKSFQLININGYLSLQSNEKNAPGAVFVDFINGSLAHRKKYGGGKNQLIAKAVGIKPKTKLSVLDVTAGLGRDAFVLATLGCDVVMCERSQIIFALLQDGLKRAKKESWFCELSLKLIHADAIDYLKSMKNLTPDIIYIDPMFPEKNKSALVKKEMRVLREVVGDDLDAEKLLEAALQVAKKRVVVKRAKLAPTLTEKKPDVIFMGKSSRFDVYLTRLTVNG
ncbi:MAG TPA: class I SAM-dependent methyltransferase [Coxiellaceae bacterium]|nr:MAG: hypothetical protein A3E81_04240 [Gammaproteobacteria bacterium RIFCSPHIGHO2_12_FULL_36_30]HLB56034.1 class I SAM-dependent methyltransferase [Coxiellaceae bacterium]